MLHRVRNGSNPTDRPPHSGNTFLKNNLIFLATVGGMAWRFTAHVTGNARLTDALPSYRTYLQK